MEEERLMSISRQGEIMAGVNKDHKKHRKVRIGAGDTGRGF